MSNVFPPGGHPRIFRYVEPGTLPIPRCVAILDKSKNLLIIDREKFQSLSAIHQQIVLTTSQPYIELSTRVFA